ncbi:MAG: 4-hydroxy-tetrahydrodipicolinate reductase [Spiribacter sp.]|jgi:4-hydroxy-tetrahydrodipicolinate reductase|nr:4-hydroxy-tetrahydrodipicolinate reductase [Spiribacter sp.]MDR9489318.1 4-hydroxy-tetrahydrodipicolinate reductase [Spiribacter sp.]
MTAIGILGAEGRMGQTLVALVAASDSLSLAAAVVQSGSERCGDVAGSLIGNDALDVRISDDPQAAAAVADVLIDFTLPDALANHLSAAVAANTPLVIGTTGLDRAEIAAIDQAARQIPLVYAANYSSGITLMLRLAELAASALNADYDVEILETHHRHKIDAPSGTAKALGERIASARGVELDNAAVYARHGLTGERQRGDIGIQTLRAGDVVGEHTVMFASEGERIELTHRASSRQTFAHGALRAARWLTAQPAGRYDMQDVLGLRG